MKKILVVDDDVAILEVLELVLEEEGYEVLTDTGYKSFGLAQAHQPDVVLLDIWMRGLDGREISQQIKTEPNLTGAAIILMSAHSHSHGVVEEAQADAFIEKPFEIDALLRLIKKYV
jgi:CheY-like chemotaxis protein